MSKSSPSFMKAAVNRISRSKLSVIGAVLLIFVSPILSLSVFLDIQGIVNNPYFGFLIYLVLGPLFLLGIILLFIGIITSRGKEDIGLFTFEYIEEQLARPGRYSRIRRHLYFSVTLTLVTLFLVALVSYTGFHYTESNAFCGQFCHTVMEPAFTSHSNSPHSRISCVNCHMGKGSRWMTKTKFSGVKQLFAVMFDTYHRPIRQPIDTLRPTRATCEECHRPDMFHGDKLYIKDRFLPDKDNTHVQTALLMRIGSGGYLGRKAHGIHWHVSEDNQVFYKYSDLHQEEIAQVWLQNGNKKTIYSKTALQQQVPATLLSGTVRKMDCMDCHNRPTHVFLSAEEALDEKILMGVIPRTIPFIKKNGVEIVSRQYDSVEQALEAISQDLFQWYEKNYPDFTSSKKHLLDKAVAGIQQAYRENVFPDMEVGWNTYDNFIGHKDGNGCFRCHKGEHVSEEGKVISHDCDSCHVILAENEPQPDVLRILKEEAAK